MTEPDPDRAATAVVQRFPPTNGRLTGVLGLVTAGVVLAIALSDWDAGTPLGVAIAAGAGALLDWVALLRPAVWTTRDDLVVRGMLRTDWIPLAAIDTVVITQMLAVGAGGKRYLSPVIGYSVRHSVKGRFGAGEAKAENSYQEFVETRIAHLAQEARTRSGIVKGSPEQQALVVRRTWAWPEIVAFAVLGIAFVTWLLVS